MIAVVSVSFFIKSNQLHYEIKSASLPEQQVSLTQLLTSINCKIRSLRKAEKA